MNIIEKYKLYKKILKSNPVNIQNLSTEQIGVNRFDWDFNDNKITAVQFVDLGIFPTYTVFIQDKDKKRIYFENYFMAKKLYEHGQKSL